MPDRTPGSVPPDGESETRPHAAAPGRHLDEAAFRALFLRHYAPLCRHAVRFVRDASRAEGLVQDVFLALWERRARWRVRDDAEGYLFRAVRNRALDVLKHDRVVERWQRDHRSAARDGRRASPSEADLAHAELVAAVERAIEKLPDAPREAFLLHRREDLSYAAIAEQLGVSVKTVEKRISHALRDLRTTLDAYVDPGAP